jgi:hypothetical protein
MIKTKNLIILVQVQRIFSKKSNSDKKNQEQKLTPSLRKKSKKPSLTFENTQQFGVFFQRSGRSLNHWNSDMFVRIFDKCSLIITSRYMALRIL